MEVTFEMKQELESGIGIEPKAMLKILIKRFNLAYGQAKEIYRTWRSEYVRPGYVNAGRKLYKFEIDKINKFAKQQARRSKIGLTEQDYFRIIQYKMAGMIETKIAEKIGKGLKKSNIEGIIAAARKNGVINSDANIYKRCV